MKTYTLEELRLAQAKKCRIEFNTEESAEWKTVAPLILAHALVPEYAYRIHPADEWKARLPRLREGAEWACDGSSYDENERPLIVGEVGSYLFLCDGTWEDGLCYEKPEEPFTGIYRKTTRPVPPEFLHTDELAKQPEARVKELEGALHLLPIAEAGPVPEGMIRLYAHRIQLGPPSAEFWSAFSEPGEEDTHCVDIHPPKQ